MPKMGRQRNITLPICATALYDQNVATEFHEVDIAMILANIEYWVSVNELNEKDLDKPLHFHDGKWWTFGTIEFYQKYFSHLTYKQVKARLQRLEDCGYIVSGNFNKMKMDKTKWYTLSDEYKAEREAQMAAVNGGREAENTRSNSQMGNRTAQMGPSATTVRSAQMGQAIPYRTHTNIENNNDLPFGSSDSTHTQANDEHGTQQTTTLEASETLGEDKSAETTKHTGQDNQHEVPPESENKLNNEEFAKKVYNRVQARLRRATATARKVGNTERMQYFADQLRLWRKPDKRATILSRIQWLLDADIYTQGQIENVLMDTVNGYYMRKEVNESGEEVEISVPNDLVRVLTQSDQDQMLWQLDKNFKITDEVIDELLGGEDDGEEPC